MKYKTILVVVEDYRQFTHWRDGVIKGLSDKQSYRATKDILIIEDKETSTKYIPHVITSDAGRLQGYRFDGIIPLCHVSEYDMKVFRSRLIVEGKE